MTLNQFDHLVGQFVKITAGGLSKDVIIGKEFGLEIESVLGKFEKTIYNDI